MYRFVFKDGHPAIARVLQQRGVEVVATDGASAHRNFESPAIAGRKKCASNDVLRKGAHLAGHTEPFERWPAVGIEDVTADFMAWELSVFDKSDRKPLLCAASCGRCARRAATNHNEVKLQLRN